MGLHGTESTATEDGRTIAVYADRLCDGFDLAREVDVEAMRLRLVAFQDAIAAEIEAIDAIEAGGPRPDVEGWEHVRIGCNRRWREVMLKLEATGVAWSRVEPALGYEPNAGFASAWGPLRADLAAERARIDRVIRELSSRVASCPLGKWGHEA